MPRVLLAASQNWYSTARLPLTLSSAGIEVHAIAPPGAAVLYSSCLTEAQQFDATPPQIAEKTLEHAAGYDRVIICDDPLLTAALQLEDARVDAVLPGPKEHVAALIDKTRFPQLAAEAGVLGPQWVVANDLSAVRRAVTELGGNVLVKGAHGAGGAVVRPARSRGAATQAALELGFPVVVEERLAGDLALMPVLYERGRVIGVFAAYKRRLIRARGPSTSLIPWAVDDALLEVARRFGERFGLHGFVSFDVFRDAENGEIRVIEVNLRPVHSLHVAKRLGVDMAGLLFEVLHGRVPAAPMKARGGAPVPMYPEELRRLQKRWGRVIGTARWIVTPRAVSELPWGDAGLLTHYLNGGE